MNILGKTDQEKFLWYLTAEGIIDKYGEDTPQYIIDRINMEMDVITGNNFTDYILMIWDIMDFCRTPSRVNTFCAMNGMEPPVDGIIPTGPGRGSVGGSAVCYCIDIHKCDPLLFGLYFERFLNPERIAYPDIDFDVSQRYRHILIAYIAWRYGRDHVAQIITYGTLAVRTVIEEVLKAANVPSSLIKQVKETIPEDPTIVLADMLKDDRFMKAMNSVIFPDVTVDVTIANAHKLLKSEHSGLIGVDYEAVKNVSEGKLASYKLEVKSTWTVQKALDIMESLEGLNKHESTHAAGVVVAPVTLEDHVPLLQKDGDGVLACQYDMRSLEELGYLKMDALGLRTVDVNHEASRLVRQWYDPDFDIDEIPYDDKDALELIRTGDTVGIFQIESSGFTQMMMQLDIGGYDCHPRSLTEVEKSRGIDITDFMWISAGLALYRPGPLDAVIEGKTMVKHLIDRKAGIEPTTYLFPEEKEYLEESYGIMIYQEQVMRRVRQMTGCTYGRADTLRKAMGKKDPILMKDQMDWFEEQAMKHNFTSLPMTEAQKLKIVKRTREEMEKFARYGFNKAHTVEYGHICYDNSYLKAHYPVAFYTALLNSEVDNPKRTTIIIRDMLKHGIKLLPPLVSQSDIYFTMTDKDTIRFGLAAIKGLGEKGLASILEEKKKGAFTSPEDFKCRVPATLCNVNSFTALIQCGAFDDMLDKCIVPMENRATLAASAKNICEAIKKFSTKKGKNKPKPTPQEAMEKLIQQKYVKESAEEDLIEYATWEKSILNYFISAHPIDAYTSEISRWNAVSDTDEADLPSEFYIAGFIGGYHETTIKKEGRNKGKKMGFVMIETEFRAYEATLFPGIYESCLPYMTSGNPVVLKGKKDFYNGSVTIQGVYIRNMTNSGIRDCPECHIYLNEPNVMDMMSLRQMFDEHPGLTDVFIHLTDDRHEITIQCEQKIALNDRIIDFCDMVGRLTYKQL